jgi:lipid A 3-O-deacylase
MRAAVAAALLVAQAWIGAHGAAAEEERWLTLTWENDWNTADSGYTNGMGVGWGRGPYRSFDDADLPRWLGATARALPYSRDDAFTHDISYRVSQLMFTPDDISAEEVIEDDRPYAGILLWSAHLHSWRERFSNRYRLTLGAVGPVSGAEQVQELAHKLISVNKANGWDNQLDNEPVFMLSNERLYRLADGRFGDALEYDVLGLTELMAGTLRSEVGAGAGFRIGAGLARSFASVSLVPGRNVHPLGQGPGSEWYAFVNLYARYVFNDITLDGNYFSDSHSVDLTHEQALYALGLAWRSARWGVVASYQESSRTFEERKEVTGFGSVSVTFAL